MVKVLCNNQLVDIWEFLELVYEREGSFNYAFCCGLEVYEKGSHCVKLFLVKMGKKLRKYMYGRLRPYIYLWSNLFWVKVRCWAVLQLVNGKKSARNIKTADKGTCGTVTRLPIQRSHKVVSGRTSFTYQGPQLVRLTQYLVNVKV